MTDTTTPQRPQTPEGNAIYRVPDSNLEALKARISKMNKRAAKLKMSPLVLSEIGEEFEKRFVRRGGSDPIDGDFEIDETVSQPRNSPKTITIRIVLVTLTGTCPRVNGWAMAATIQHEEGGNILRTVPGFETVLPLVYRSATTSCDHCRTDRRRNDTYVLQSEGGDWKQVGRNCLADFLRTSDASGLAEWAEILAGLDEEMGEFEDESFGGGGRLCEYFTALKLLTQVACCVRVDGWCSRSEAKASFVPKCATVDSAMSLWDSKIWDKLSAADQERLTPTEADELRASEAIAWAQELPADVGNDYLWNIRVVSHKEMLSGREAGLAGSIIAAYNRHIEKELARKYENAHPSEWFGTEGERGVFTLTVTGTREMSNDFGLTTLVLFRDAAGNKGKWFCSGTTELKTDETYTVKATVKKHEVYTPNDQNGALDVKSSKQTLLSRVVVFDAAAEADQKAKLKAARKAVKGKYECPHEPKGWNFEIPELEGLTRYTEYAKCCLDCQNAWVARANACESVAA